MLIKHVNSIQENILKVYAIYFEDLRQNNSFSIIFHTEEVLQDMVSSIR